MPSSRAKLSSNGRVVIPVSYRKALGLKPGDEVVITLGDGELRLSTARHAMRRLQALVRKHVPKGTSLADELIRERRAEAMRE
jgi:AbrB family looped-hinge helix DNA binding protein